VSIDRIVTGCGSMALLEHVIKVTCLVRDEVICAWPSFDPYPVIAAAAGARARLVRLTVKDAHDLTAMAAAVSERTRLILVCSPNNPTGVGVPRHELSAFLDAVPSDVLVALDEAYHGFVTDPDVVDGVRDCGDRPNVVILRTFSKAWGIAGLRVGYLVAPAPVAATVRAVTTLWSTSAIGQAAALAALAAEEELRDLVQRVIRERERLLAAVRTMIPDTPESQGNFLWLPVGARSAELAQVCDRANVIVRVVRDRGVRVSIGTPEENDAFLAALADAFAPAPQ
jgi:histidinol-phosphate aminotransferase